MVQREERQTQAGEAKPEYTWDDFVAAIGQDFSQGDHVADETIEYVSVVRFCEVWEIGNPIYWYEEVAKQAGYAGVVVPWSAIKQTFGYKGSWRPGQPTKFPLNLGRDASAELGSFFPGGESRYPKPHTTRGAFTNMEIEFFEPVCLGDHMTLKGHKLVNVRVRPTRVGYGAFVDRAIDVYNQRGQLVARTIQGSFRGNA